MQTSMRHSKLPPQFQNVSTRLVLCTQLAPPNRRSHGTPTPRGKMASHAVQHESQAASHLLPLPTTAAPSCAQCMAHMCNLQYATPTWQQRPQPVHEPVSADVTQQCACHAAAAFLQRRQLHVALVCESAAPLCSLAFESSLAPTCFVWHRLVLATTCSSTTWLDASTPLFSIGGVLIEWVRADKRPVQPLSRSLADGRSCAEDRLLRSKDKLLPNFV